MYLDANKGMLGGAKVTFIVEDDQGKPDVDVTKAKKLILSGQGQHAGRRRARVYRLMRWRRSRPAEKMLYMGTDCHRRRSRASGRLREISLSWCSPAGCRRSRTHPLGQWACEQGYKRISVIIADYAFGHETAGGFLKAFED